MPIRENTSDASGQPRGDTQSDSEMLDFIEANEAWLTYASDQAKTAKAWRCLVAERRFPSPDIRERSGREGYGKTARQAIAAAMRSPTVPPLPN